MRPKPKASPLDKKILPNPKYKNVENVVDTGNNLRTELEKLEEVHQFYKFRNDEVFRRVNINNLVRLLIEQTKLEYQLNPPLSDKNVEQELVDDMRSEFNDSITDELEFDYHDQNDANEAADNEDIRSIIQSQFEGQVLTGRPSRQATARSVTSVAQGVGELDREEEAAATDTVARPFLILDVRDPEDFSRGHLVYSHNYPHTRLNRAFDYETKEMLRVKNKAAAILVVYDNDESVARQTATTLTQRGYDNVFMLSGGLRVARLKYPDTGLVTAEEGAARLEEGEVMVLDQALEDNILAGEAAGPAAGSRTGRPRHRQLARSSILRWSAASGHFRTSTALGGK